MITSHALRPAWTPLTVVLMIAGFWYLVVVSVASVGQAGLERRFGRGHATGLRR